MSQGWSRRQFLKRSIAAATAAAAGMPLTRALAADLDEMESAWKWDKGVCRFCGVGCGILVASETILRLLED